jgi:hypothetical protein
MEPPIRFWVFLPAQVARPYWTSMAFETLRMCHYLKAVASICEFNGVIGPIRPLTSHDLDLFGQIQSILRKAPLEVIGICSVRVCKSPGKKEQRFKLVNNYKFAIYIYMCNILLH